MRKVALMLAAVAGFATTSAVAEDTVAASEPPPSACTAAEHRQFDFWIGHWDVTRPDGNPAGVQHIESTQNGCVLLEHWTGARGNTGVSISSYDPATKSWKQFWSDSDGLVLLIEGKLEGRAMVMHGKLPNAAQGFDLQRVTWTPADDGTLRQLWESSSDDGKTWSAVFEGNYRRK